MAAILEAEVVHLQDRQVVTDLIQKQWVAWLGNLCMKTLQKQL